MYAENILSEFKKKGIRVGDTVSIEFKGKEYKGVLIENPGKNADIIEIKLENGYNIGIKYNETLKFAAGAMPQRTIKSEGKTEEKDYDAAILMFGGTISSKVEYKTGAVFPSMTAGDFEDSFPEAGRICRVGFKNVLSILSEDINAEHWKIMGEKAYMEIKDGKCVVITHGTDTMGYSAAALSFMIQNPAKPIVLTGAQRSSDRGSSDSTENLLNSLYYAKHGKGGVFVCMHAETNDGFGSVHLGTKVRKMHTSRRDAFKSINAFPAAKVDWSKKKIEYSDDEFWNRKEGEMHYSPKFNDNVALIWVHPNIKPLFISKLSEYDGVVFAATGLGHVPSNPLNDKMAKPIIDEIRGLANSGVMVAVAPQTLYGRINLDVYTAGRMLKDAGVMGHLCDWLPETAFVKLCWVLGQTKDEKKVREMMNTNYAGELSDRSFLNQFMQ